ncbi:MAG: hypothetical protein QCI38_00580 [Candidatus Thermoplasmatota archaeon]|nr:hypothetical protein [Candidatus Thermoplasmatota archaeon]
MKKKQKEVHLVEGSRYHLKSIATRDETLETEGIFLGYTSIGSDEGICIKMGKSHGDLADKVRVIPTHMLLAIDLIEQKEDEEEKGQIEEKTAHYFG